MKNRIHTCIYRFLALPAAALLLLAGGCSKQSGQAQEVLLEVDITTYADANALPNEQDIRSAFVYIFRSSDGRLENPGEIEIPMVGNSGSPVSGADNKVNRTWRLYEGKKTVYVVVNPNAAVHAALSAATKISDLLAISTAVGDFDTDLAAISAKGMVMSGVTENFVVSPTNNIVNVKVERRHARIEFSMRKSVDMASSSVVLQRATFTGQKHLTTLMPAATYSETGNADQTCELITAGTPLPVTYHKDSKDASGNPLYNVIGRVYTYQRHSPATAAQLEIDATVNGVQRFYTIYLSELTNGFSDPAKPISLLHNTIYNVQATVNPEGITLFIGHAGHLNHPGGASGGGEGGGLNEGGGSSGGTTGGSAGSLNRP